MERRVERGERRGERRREREEKGKTEKRKRDLIEDNAAEDSRE